MVEQPLGCLSAMPFGNQWRQNLARGMFRVCDMRNSQLQSVLTAVKKPHRALRFPDGTQMLLLVHGGRALGLFAAGDEENFLWTNPALASPTTASTLFASNAWHNSGGDRIWLSPEIDVFF